MITATAIFSSLAFSMERVSPSQNLYNANQMHTTTTTTTTTLSTRLRHPSSGDSGKQVQYTRGQSQQFTLRSNDKVLRWTPETVEGKEASDDKFTPPDQIGMRAVNPFDIGIADRLHLPAFSPSVFSVIETPDKQKEPFWSIEQIAVLRPADIEETPNQEHAGVGNDAETERRAQDAINRFFSQHEIVPSPWLPTEPIQVRSRSFSPAATSTACMKKTVTRKCISRQDAWTQTALTLPLDLDIEKLLGQYYTFPTQQCKLSGYTSQMSEGDESKDSLLSTSTLRRKLFVHDSICSSPDKKSSPSSDQNSPPVSPLKETPGKDKHSLLSSSNSAQFSSSPIISTLGRSSISPLNKMSPPCLSPISKSLLKTPGSSSSGSGSVKSRHVTISKCTAHEDSMQSMSVNNTFSSVSIDRLYNNEGAETSCIKFSVGDEEMNSCNGVQKAMYLSFSANDSAEPKLHETENDPHQYNSLSEMESFPAIISQDTGYQTGSLQSTTNPDYTHMSIFVHKAPTAMATTSITSCNLQRVGIESPTRRKPGTERNITRATKPTQESEKSDVDFSYKVASSSGYCSMTFSKREADINPSCLSSWEPMHSSTPTKESNDICGMSIDDTR